MFSSAGKSQARRGRTIRMMLRSMGTRINPPSYARTRPAPRETHTDHVKPFRTNNFLLVAYCVGKHISDWGEGTRIMANSTDLTVPTISEPKDMRAVEENVEDETSRSQELALKPAFAHDY